MRGARGCGGGGCGGSGGSGGGGGGGGAARSGPRRPQPAYRAGRAGAERRSQSPRPGGGGAAGGAWEPRGCGLRRHCQPGRCMSPPQGCLRPAAAAVEPPVAALTRDCESSDPLQRQVASHPDSSRPHSETQMCPEGHSPRNQKKNTCQIPLRLQFILRSSDAQSLGKRDLGSLILGGRRDI